VLSILVGDTIVAGTRLVWDSPVITSYAPGHDRLEYELFSLQQQKAESLKKLSSSRLVPKLWAYGQAGYGRPGFNMLLNKFDDYYIIGAKLSWNFYNWKRPGTKIHPTFKRISLLLTRNHSTRIYRSTWRKR
jgi:hypothetical protein